MNFPSEFKKTYPDFAKEIENLIAENINLKKQNEMYQRKISDLEKQLPPKFEPIQYRSPIKPINQRKNSF